MASADLTRFALTLGSRNAVSGIREKSYAETIIRGSIQPKGSAAFFPISGKLSQYDNTGYFPDLIHENDIIKDEAAYYYEVKTAPQFWRLNQFIGFYPCEMAKLQNYPETSITPPTPDEDDPRYRTRVWINTYLSLTCDWASLYAYPNYPLQYEFTGENVTGTDAEDTLFLVGHPDSTALIHADKNVYGYDERVPITIAVLEQYTQSNTEKTLWAAEDALRTICDPDHDAAGIRRTLKVVRDKTERHGNCTITMRECLLSYKRSSGYTPSYPTITWGPSAAPTGTFIFPNVTDIEYYHIGTDAKSHPPGFIGDIKQPLGDGPLRVKITCDPDVAPSALAWKRSQTGAATDKMNWQVLADIKHNGGINQPYQTLKLDWCPTSGFKVRLIDYTTMPIGEKNILEATFEEYTNTDQSGNTIVQRWNIS